MQNTAPKFMEHNGPSVLKSCGWFLAADIVDIVVDLIFIS